MTKPKTFSEIAAVLLEETVNNKLLWSCASFSFGDVYTVERVGLKFKLFLDKRGRCHPPELYVDDFKMSDALDCTLFVEICEAVKRNHEYHVVKKFNSSDIDSFLGHSNK